MKELEYPFNSEMIIANKKRIKKNLLSSDENRIEKKIAILGGSTTRDLMQVLELFLLNYGIKPSFYESEYNQYYEDGAFPNSALEEFKPDIIYIHTSLRNILDLPIIEDSRRSVEEKNQSIYQHFVNLWEHLSLTYHCPIIQNNFELPYYRILGNREASDYRGICNFVTKLNLKIYDYADTHDNFYIHDIAYEQADYGISAWSNPYYWHMYKYCCAVPAIPLSAFNIANIIKSIFGKNKKALNLDLDNTLWGGVIGDDGADNIEIGQETSLGQVYAEFQNYVKKLKTRGILLTVNSKNDENNAIEGFNRPDSVLKRGDFVSFKANWQPKSKNLFETATELNILPESFVFVDDNPAERELIRQTFPGTAVAKIDKPEEYVHDLDRGGYFEATNISADDLKRNEMYQANAARATLMASFSDYGEYLKSLEMKGEIQHFIPAYMSRIVQFTNKSNQFNLTTKRYTQSEIEIVSDDKAHITLYGKLSDRFGDNGVVSVVIGEIRGDELHVELWLMSCRVLKRDMEFAMMDELVKKCNECGIKKIVGYYYPTAKNGMVKDFYERQGFTKVSEDNLGNTIWHFDINNDYKNKNLYIDVVNKR